VEDRTLTDDEQEVPFPLSGVTGTDDGRVDLLVGIIHILNDVVGAFVDLLNRRFLLLNELGHFLI
jgi:hypothetical protein